MRHGWHKQTWLINYAARKSWAFDFTWWKFLEETYSGPNENQDCQARLEHLSETQRRATESVVARKIEESGNRQIIGWGGEDAADRLAEIAV